MHTYPETAVATIFGAGGGSLFLLELFHIAQCDGNLCCTAVIVFTALLLLALYKVKSIWSSENGVIVGLLLGAAMPLVSLLF